MPSLFQQSKDRPSVDAAVLTEIVKHPLEEMIKQMSVAAKFGPKNQLAYTVLLKIEAEIQRVEAGQNQQMQDTLEHEEQTEAMKAPGRY